MDEKQVTAELVEEKETGERLEEPEYIIPPHPEITALSSTEAANPGEPVAARDLLSDLIQQAVDGLRVELRAELETQAKMIQTELQAELQSELKGDLELNAKS